MEVDESKVEQLDVSHAIEHDVGGFDVAMDDAQGVRVGERQRQLPSDLAGIRRRDRTDNSRELAQIQSINKFHRQILHTRVRACIGGGDDSGMLQLSSGTNLAFEALQRLRVRPLGRDEFEGDDLFQLGMFGAIDTPHTAASDAFQDTILAHGNWGRAG